MKGCVGSRPPTDKDGQAGTGELISIWLGEPPEEELALWSGMSQAHRAEASKRLAAISAYEAAGAGMRRITSTPTISACRGSIRY